MVKLIVDYWSSNEIDIDDNVYDQYMAGELDKWDILDLYEPQIYNDSHVSYREIESVKIQVEDEHPNLVTD